MDDTWQSKRELHHSSLPSLMIEVWENCHPNMMKLLTVCYLLSALLASSHVAAFRYVASQTFRRGKATRSKWTKYLEVQLSSVMSLGSPAVFLSPLLLHWFLPSAYEVPHLWYRYTSLSLAVNLYHIMSWAFRSSVKVTTQPVALHCNGDGARTMKNRSTWSAWKDQEKSL